MINALLDGVAGDKNPTEILHALRQEGFEGVQTAALGVHAFGQRVAEVHLVLEEEARRGRRGGSVAAGAPPGHRGRRWRRGPAVQVRVAVAGAGRCGVAHVVEEDVVRRRRRRVPALKVQVQTGGDKHADKQTMASLQRTRFKSQHGFPLHRPRITNGRTFQPANDVGKSEESCRNLIPLD